MKYTISIADDEPRVRTGLQSLINSRGGDWEVSGLFPDGTLALEAAGERQVDVILADIRMPSLDGLQLAHALRTVSPDTVVVVMSGYKEFDYARRAMKMGVLDFIVKPIEEEELFAVLDRARQEIERRKDDRRQAVLSREPEAIGDALLAEALVSPSTVEIGEKLPEFLGVRLGAFVVLCVQILEKPAPTRSEIQDALRRRADSDSLHVFAFQDSVVILVTPTVDPPGSELSLASEVASELSRLFGGRGRIGISLRHEGSSWIRAAYEESVAAVRPGYYERTGSIFSFTPWTAPAFPFPVPAQDKLAACLVTGDRAATEACARDFLRPYGRARVPTKLLDEHVEAVVGHVQDILSSLLPDGDEIRTATRSLTPVFRHGWFDRLESEFVQIMGTLSAKVEQANRNRQSRAVRRAVRYIEENCNRDLPLDEIAKSVGLSPSYFSSSFKRETGRNVVEYITEHRVEKAIKLLSSTNLNTSEVAYQVGFNDPKYFARIFKRSVGVRPSLYRKYSQEK